MNEPKAWKVGDKCWYLLLHKIYRADIIAADEAEVTVLNPYGFRLTRCVDRVFCTRKEAALELATLDAAILGAKAAESAREARALKRIADNDARKLEKAKKRIAAMKALGS